MSFSGLVIFLPSFQESCATPYVIECYYCLTLTHEECAEKWWKSQVGFSEGRWRGGIFII